MAKKTFQKRTRTTATKDKHFAAKDNATLMNRVSETIHAIYMQEKNDIERFIEYSKMIQAGHS